MLTDYLMPVMSGEEIVKRARAAPPLKVEIMTRHGDAVAAADPVWWEAEGRGSSLYTSAFLGPPPRR